MTTIRETIQQLADQKNEIFSAVCTVNEVDQNTAVIQCTPVDGRAGVPNARLQASIAPGVLVIPKVGSEVVVTFINNNAGYVAQFSEVEKIIFQDGTNDGMVLINPLVSQLNKLESDINQLKGFFSAWVTVPSDGGAALKLITAPWFGSTLTPTIKGDIENENITQ